MRLLLRASSHVPASDGSLVLAASPDTPGREAWQWYLRLSTGPGEHPDGAVAAGLQLPPSAAPWTSAELATDPDAVRPELDLLDVSSRAALQRGAAEVTVLVAVDGDLTVEGRHRMSRLDALVLEGDDPLTVGLEPHEGSAANVLVARVVAPRDGMLRWVP